MAVTYETGAIVRCVSGDTKPTSGYPVGTFLIETDTGKTFVNTGSAGSSTWTQIAMAAPAGASSTVTPTDNTTRTPSTTRPTEVTLYAIISSTTLGDDVQFQITVGAHNFGGIPRWKNPLSVGTDAVAICLGTFTVAANTTYKVAKTNNSGTPTVTYSAEELIL